MTETPVAVVTGANLLLGYGICRQLKGAGVDVVLTARDAAKSEAAAADLGVRFHVLDVTSQISVDALALWLATLSDDGPTGGFLQDRRRIDW